MTIHDILHDIREGFPEVLSPEQEKEFFTKAREKVNQVLFGGELSKDLEKVIEAAIGYGDDFWTDLEGDEKEYGSNLFLIQELEKFLNRDGLTIKVVPLDKSSKEYITQSIQKLLPEYKKEVLEDFKKHGHHEELGITTLFNDIEESIKDNEELQQLLEAKKREVVAGIVDAMGVV